MAVSSYGASVVLQNNSASAAATAAPTGSVFLFASGSQGSAKLFMNKEGSQDVFEVGADLKFAGDSGTGTVGLGAGQTFTIAGGTGLDTSASGQTLTFSMDLNELSAAAVDVSADSIAIVDANDSNASKKESIADLMTAVAGNGLAASSGVLAVGVDDTTIELNSDALRIKDGGVDADALASSVAGNGLAGGGGTALSVDLNELSAAAVNAAADSIAIIDADDNSSKKESIADLATAMAGDGLAASSGVFAVGVDDSSIEINSDSLRVKASGITSAMIADGAIVNADVNASAAISLTKIDGNVDMGGDFILGNQANDTLLISGPLKLGANTLVDSGNNAAIALDGSQGFSTLGGFGGGSGVTFASSGGAQFATDLTVNKSDGSMNKDVTFYGDTAGAYFQWDGGEDRVKIHNGSAQVLEMGNTTNGFAIDVANGSANVNKVRAAAFVTYSDESLKQDVQTMNTALDTVMSLNGVEFTWKDSGERDFGFIAQDVQNVLPKAVHTAGNGVQGVDYSRLTSVLVEAVKAQQVQIEELKALLKK